jgi:16S rRNA (cytosine967-C5)-methyltransferase
MSSAKKKNNLPTGEAADELRSHLMRIYAQAVQSEYPTDHLVGFYLRKNPKLVGSGKGFVAATLYALLRKRIRTVLLWQACNLDGPRATTLTPLATLNPEEEAWRAIGRWIIEDLHAKASMAYELVRAAGASAGWEINETALSQFLGAVADGDLPTRLSPDLAEAARLNLHPELLTRWRQRFGRESLNSLAESFQQPAPLQVRVNTSLITRDRFIQALRAAGVEATPTRYSPTGVECGQKVNLQRLDGLTEGWWEVQDEGSQLVSLAVDPQPGWRVLDACAGGGGKAIHLACLQPKAQVEAYDLDPERLEPLTARRERAALRNVRSLDAQPAPPQQWDAVLVDAPCLGIGRLRRDPTVQYRGGTIAERARKAAADQIGCLRSYAPCVARGGILLYALCSFEREETDDVLATFQQEFPDFVPDPLPKLFQTRDFAPLRSPDGSRLILVPPLHGTDGFFMARFRRR